MPRKMVRMTVMKRVDPSVIFDGEASINPGSGRPFEICTTFEEGQEFLVETDNAMLEGFCPQAWHDIFRKLGVLHWEGKYGALPAEGQIVACCIDGIRPVSFRLERMDELPR
ncbi:MAG: TIGR04076 family protein [Candidatus Bathyarchaeota archaeon]|nr:MAG: TIGR04076 family protein [Candidatus Bathyarchaeota archaeon]